MYGDLDPRTATAYFQYGSSLLFNAQDTSDMLGGLVKDAAIARAKSLVGASLEQAAGGTWLGRASVPPLLTVSCYAMTSADSPPALQAAPPERTGLGLPGSAQKRQRLEASLF